VLQAGKIAHGSIAHRHATPRSLQGRPEHFEHAPGRRNESGAAAELFGRQSMPWAWQSARARVMVSEFAQS